MDQLDLSFFFKTKLQAQDFSSRLSQIMSKVYSNDFNLEKELQGQLGIEKKDKFITLLRDYHIPTQSPAPLKDFLEKIVKSILEMPTLTLTIAFEPKQENLETFAQWFLLNIKKQILLDIKVDPTLIGGAMVAYEGRFLDGTVKSVFETVLQQAMTPPQPQTPSATPPSQSAVSDSKAVPIEHLHFGR